MNACRDEVACATEQTEDLAQLFRKQHCPKKNASFDLIELIQAKDGMSVLQF